MNESFSLLEGKPFYYKVFILILLILMGTSVVGGLGYFTVSNLFGLSGEDVTYALGGHPKEIPVLALKILQGFFSLGTFLIPALAYIQLSKEGESKFLGLKNKVAVQAWVLLVVLMFVISPVVDGLVYFNMNLPMPEFLEGMMAELIAQQEMLSQQMEYLLAMDNLQGLMLNVLIIAAIPAIGEEWLFRGVIQKILKEHFLKVHLSIWLTAFFFAVLHQSVFYFFGLWLLGALLGYLKEWSGNIWYPVLGHFINNATILFVTFFYPEMIGDLDTITFEWMPFILGVVLSGVLIYGIHYVLSSKKYGHKKTTL